MEIDKIRTLRVDVVVAKKRKKDMKIMTAEVTVYEDGTVESEGDFINWQK